MEKELKKETGVSRSGCGLRLSQISVCPYFMR